MTPPIRARSAPNEDAEAGATATAEGEVPHALTAAPGPRPSSDARHAWVVAAVVVVADAAAVSWAFSPQNAGSPLLLVGLVVVYGLGATVCIRRRRAAGDALSLQPRAGDVSVGAAVAALLYCIAMGAHLALAVDHSPRVAWIIRLYLQRGDPLSDVGWLLGAAVALIGAAEEITWRGLVMHGLQDVLGARGALTVTAMLFTVAHLPTTWLLRDPVAGLNPLVVAAGFGSSLVFGWVTLRTRRLAPAVFAHALFSWAVVEFPIWRP